MGLRREGTATVVDLANKRMHFPLGQQGVAICKGILNSRLQQGVTTGAFSGFSIGTGTIEALGLPYRVIGICSGDLGQSHHLSFDIEVFAPGCDRWLEVSSVSWFSDYQARRADIRFRRTGQKGTEHVHTLNGSALAVPRVLAAILENNRQPDGKKTWIDKGEMLLSTEHIAKVQVYTS